MIEYCSGTLLEMLQRLTNIQITKSHLLSHSVFYK
jgi:hypothetical protein